MATLDTPQLHVAHCCAGFIAADHSPVWCPCEVEGLLLSAERGFPASIEEVTIVTCAESGGFVRQAVAQSVASVLQHHLLLPCHMWESFSVVLAAADNKDSPARDNA